MNKHKILYSQEYKRKYDKSPWYHGLAVASFGIHFTLWFIGPIYAGGPKTKDNIIIIVTIVITIALVIYLTNTICTKYAMSY